MAIGFGHPAYFNKCFHDFYGYLSGEFNYGSLDKNLAETLKEGNAVESNFISVNYITFIRNSVTLIRVEVPIFVL